MRDGSEKGAFSIIISVRDDGSGIFVGRVATAKTGIRMKKDTSFDHQPLLVVVDAVERIEVAIRTTNYNTMSEQHRLIGIWMPICLLNIIATMIS